MELYLQMGYGMKNIAIEMSEVWGGATAILSPRDMKPEQLRAWVSDFEKAGLKLMFDPQCYFPQSRHKGLDLYSYVDSSLVTNINSDRTKADEIIESIIEYNKIGHCESFIVPSVMLTYGEDWLSKWNAQSQIFVEATHRSGYKKSIYYTLALPSEFLLQGEEVIEKFIGKLEHLDVDGYYVIAEPPKGEQPMWLLNVMQICASIKLLGKRVIFGYGNHQLLCLSAANVDALATGTYLNVRRFSNKFQESDSIKKKSIWYYYPAALSEYKIPVLDVAKNAKVLQQMRPAQEMDNGYVDLIFQKGDVMPSSTSFGETLAFKHYLNCVKVQANNISRTTFDETISANEVLLENAQRRIEYLEERGVYGSARSFKEIVDVNRTALKRLELTRGFQLRMEWK